MRNNVVRFALVAILLVAVAALAFQCRTSVDSAPGQPTPVLDLFGYLPIILNAPTPTPRPTTTPLPTMRPTPPPL